MSETLTLMDDNLSISKVGTETIDQIKLDVV